MICSAWTSQVSLDSTDSLFDKVAKVGLTKLMSSNAKDIANFSNFIEKLLKVLSNICCSTSTSMNLWKSTEIRHLV